MLLRQACRSSLCYDASLSAGNFIPGWFFIDNSIQCLLCLLMVVGNPMPGPWVVCMCSIEHLAGPSTLPSGSTIRTGGICHPLGPVCKDTQHLINVSNFHIVPKGRAVVYPSPISFVNPVFTILKNHHFDDYDHQYDDQYK